MMIPTTIKIVSMLNISSSSCPGFVHVNSTIRMSREQALDGIADTLRNEGVCLPQHW